MNDIEWREPRDIDKAYRQDIRRRFRWAQVLKALAIAFRPQPSGHIFILCLYHGEKSPSLHFWPNGSFLCHGCHWGWWGGDVATFVFMELSMRKHGTNGLPFPKSALDAFFEALTPVPDAQLRLPLP